MPTFQTKKCLIFCFEMLTCIILFSLKFCVSVYRNTYLYSWLHVCIFTYDATSYTLWCPMDLILLPWIVLIYLEIFYDVIQITDQLFSRYLYKRKNNSCRTKFLPTEKLTNLNLIQFKNRNAAACAFILVQKRV